ncbi:MAG: molybdopterin converting factor subunit 1 [Gammaproteobacteria bacterium]|nr:molybdopterin converting factor subunit 1 [Gammaproteobacteria bacterium]
MDKSPKMNEKKKTLALKIVYFASLREALKTSDENIELGININIAQLKQQLIEKHGEQHFPSNILCAVNHEIANDSTQLNDNDEVAFYPPVTGG